MYVLQVCYRRIIGVLEGWYRCVIGALCLCYMYRCVIGVLYVCYTCVIGFIGVL